MSIIGKTGNSFRKYEVEDILRVFSDEEDAFGCFQAACGVGMDRNWPIGKKFYIYNDTYAVMRVYEVKEPRSLGEIIRERYGGEEVPWMVPDRIPVESTDGELGRMPGQNPVQMPGQAPVQEGTDAQ
jgi:hypothetical protein